MKAVQAGGCKSRRRALRAVGAKCGVALREMVVVVIVLGVLSAIVVPQFTNAGTGITSDERVGQQLRTVRAAIELFRAQHNDAAPDLAGGWKPLMSRTDARGGTSGSSTIFGPYLPSAPVNPLTGGTRIATTPEVDADWWWDASSGRITALDGNGAPFVELK